MTVFVAKLAIRDEKWSARLRVDEKPFWKGVASVAAHLGDGPLWIIVWAAGIILFAPPRRWQFAVWVLVSIISAFLTYAIKFSLKRPRPREVDGFYNKGYDRHAFPSGHATRMGTLPIMGAWIFPDYALLFWIISFICIWARVALGVHYLGDVVVGWLIGAVVSIVALQVVGASLF